MPVKRRQTRRQPLGVPSPAGEFSQSLNEEGVLFTTKVAERQRKSQLRKRSLFRLGGEGDVLAAQDAAGGSSGEPMQYTISKMHIDNTSYFSRLCRCLGVELPGPDDPRAYIYKPSMPLANYVNWTFRASFLPVFLSFLFIFLVFCLVFGGLFALAGEFTPQCIVVSGEPYGTNPSTKFADAFAMSWTTFTTVGYGHIYTATGNNYDDPIEPGNCAGVIFLCTLEAFLGLIYAGMGTAILFGKVNRVESHAHLTFASTVCLQYAEVDSEFVDGDSTDSDCDSDGSITDENADEESNPDVRRNVQFSCDSDGRITDKNADKEMNKNGRGIVRLKSYKEKFKGCPVLTFQVVNDLCNRRGGEIIDGLMKVVGIKHKKCGGKISHTQLVRVNLVDFENPFFAQVWHGTHVLDGSSPLLTQSARRKIMENGNRWPDEWFTQVDKIRRKLDFQNLIVTVAGLSNLSASTVHAYKWYKVEDVIFGFDFAPLLYENERSGKLEVDLGLVNDVREQCRGSGEELIRPSSSRRRKRESTFISPS